MKARNSLVCGYKVTVCIKCLLGESDSVYKNITITQKPLDCSDY